MSRAARVEPISDTMARKKKKVRCSNENEPLPESEEWVEWGGELIWAAGFTPGGAPYGLTLREYREVSAQEQWGTGWARAKRILERVFQMGRGTGAQLDVGRVRLLGKGLNRCAFFTDVAIHPDPDGWTGRYVVLLPNRDVEPDFDAKVRREAAILARLNGLGPPFCVPRIAGVFPEAGRPVVVESFVDGIPLDLRAGRQPSVRPWEIVAQIAAGVHALDTEVFDGILHGYATRRDHAIALLSVFEGLDDPIAREAHAWALDHLPPATPAMLIHGDLLGQNILYWPDAQKRLPGLIDWENAMRGDPAYDLAIVTRGVRKPFQVDGGLARLLDAYALAGGMEIAPAQVHLHELYLAAGWYRQSLNGERGMPPPEHERNRLRGILRRVA